jgi:hypothetical protein
MAVIATVHEVFAGRDQRKLSTSAEVQVLIKLLPRLRYSRRCTAALSGSTDALLAVVDEAGCSGDEGAATGIGRAPVQPKILIRALEPDDDAQRCHWATSLRSNHVP